jgi:hypothetical protein
VAAGGHALGKRETEVMFVEGLGTASVANGVLRVETYVRNARGEDVPNGELLVPVTRVIAVSEALQVLIEQIRAQVAEQTDASAPAASPEGGKSKKSD